ncbi:hypothetical protein [Emergencia sp.]|uniref:hypothetical protein n=1 Tax=Emergencia sp. TaxID=1926557 RepID=UPI003AF08CB5
MKTKKYSVMSIAMLVANVAVVIGGIFFFPSLYEDIPRGTVIMGIVTVISVVLLVVGLRRKEFGGAARNLLILSYIVAGLVVFRWLITILLFPHGGIINGTWGSFF